MFSRLGSAAYKKDLTNIILLCNKLGNPQQHFKSIHVGGTNGKGSVSHMLSSILQQAGYKTGLYTSPHLYDFRERIRINGEMVDKQFVVNFVEKIRPEIKSIEPSFFEITVAMAFSFFAEAKIDVAIIEVGLGGRLDSTNIINPELSVITNIGWDHANMLGDSLEKIAFEKAGIIKQGVPVVIGERQKETEKVFLNAADERASAILYASDKCKAVKHQWENGKLDVELSIDTDKKKNYTLDLPGIYQLKNICTVVAATDVLIEHGWNINEESIKRGLENVKQLSGLSGRWEVIHQNPVVVLEVAHNEDGIQQMLKHIKELRFEKLHLVFGMVKDKNLDAILILLPPDAHYYFTQAHIPRAVSAEELSKKAKHFSLTGDYYNDVNTALDAAKLAAGKDDLIIVCGSIFLVAEVRKGF
jgi:dihydrofolate synthase / folylpolyglutamate synthase